jgi:undecaprenyl-diphosphatase
MTIYIFSVILGIVEGLTEFLPVSSTAHLLLSQKVLQHFRPELFKDQGYWDMYTVVIQLGAILCLPIYFWDRIIKFLKTFPEGERGDKTIWTHPLTLVMVAFVVTALPTLALKKLVKNNLEQPVVWGTAMLIGGIIMWVVDVVYTRRFNEEAKKGSRNAFEAGGPTSAVARGTPVTGVAAALNPAATVLDYEDAKAAKAVGFHHTEHVEEMNLLQAIWIGACQILSGVFPGTSRSMSTIASGQISGMSRESALEFSFLLSIPTMTAATLWEGLKTVGLRKSGEGDMAKPIDMTSDKWIILIIGFVVSFFVAWAVVAWFMHWVRKRGFTPFAVYRIILGTIVLVLVARGVLTADQEEPSPPVHAPLAQVAPPDWPGK